MTLRDKLGTRWPKLFSVACIALLMLATSVEVAHVHGTLLASNAPKLSQTHGIANPESNCPLCFAAHSPALAVAQVQVITVQVSESAVQVFRAQPPLQWFSFALLVRPPPIV